MNRLALLLLLGCLCVGCKGNPPFAEQGFELAIEGNRAFSDRELSWIAYEDLVDFAERGFPKSLVDDAAFAIEVYYHSEGYAFAKVDYAYDGPDAESDELRPRILIEEGARTELEELELAGVRAFDVDELRAFYAIPRRGWLSKLGIGTELYVEDAIREGSAALSKFYYGNGYREVQVSEPRVVFDEEGNRARVSISVSEGILYRLAGVELEGHAQADAEALHAEYADLIGAPYNERLGLEIRSLLTEYYGNAGYADVAVEAHALAPTIEDERGDVRLSVSIVPGPKIHIGEIRVHGLDGTRSGVVSERLTLKSGELYTRSAERRSYRNLFRSGLFDQVRLELEGEGTERNLDVTVRERDSLEFFVEPGWGSYERLRLKTGARESNAFGSGRALRAEGSVSGFAQRALLGVTDPWFLGHDLTADLSTFYNRREEPSFLRTELGATVAFSKRWTNIFKTSVSYSYRDTDSSNVEVSVPQASGDLDAAELGEQADIASVLLTPEWDWRDNPFVPTRGTRIRTDVESAADVLGSDLGFLRLFYAHSWFQPLSENTVLGASFRTGIIAPYDSDVTLPLQVRFFNGGENTVRSFREQELGPKDSGGHPIGGETLAIFNLELRQHMVGGFGGALFFDAGSVGLRVEDYFSFPDSASAVGVGLRYDLPIGPLRLDAAWNPNPADGEDDFVLHFAVGLPF